MRRALAAAAALALLSGPAAAQPSRPDPGLGRQLAAEGNPGGALACSGCHGMDGAASEGGGAFPRLADQTARYLYKQLNDYASGARPNEIMGPIAMAMSDAERQGSAAYYAAQRPPYPDPTPADPAAAAAGAALVNVGSAERRVQACANCHGPASVGVGPLFPRLAGQYAAYAEAQLLAFRQKQRHNDVNAVMREISGHLTEAEITAVSAYLETLRPDDAR